MTNIYFFQWPSNLGGADTRLKDLIQCFRGASGYKLFSVPNDDGRLLESENVNFLLDNGVTPMPWKSLPDRMDGFGISFCNFRLFSEKWRIEKIKSSGLKFIWSNDMMWRTGEEAAALREGLINATIYTSEKHMKDMSDENTSHITERIIPNYFHADNYPFIDRPIRDEFTIGKHSRADMLKYTDNFPLFYAGLPIENPRFKIMGINKNILDKFKWFDFSNRWDLMPENAIPVIDFLRDLDCYVYSSHYKFTETQCRATIEAMLTGLPVIAPMKFNFLNQIWHGKTGLLWNTYEECANYVRFFEKNADERIIFGKLARKISQALWCDKDQHLSAWYNIFNSL